MNEAARCERNEIFYGPRRSNGLARLCDLGLFVYVCITEDEDGGRERAGYALTQRGRYEQRWVRGAWNLLGKQTWSDGAVLLDAAGDPVLVEIPPADASFAISAMLSDFGGRYDAGCFVDATDPRCAGRPEERGHYTLHHVGSPTPEHLRTLAPAQRVEAMILRGALSQIQQIADTSFLGVRRARGRLNEIAALAEAFQMNRAPTPRRRTRCRA